MRQTLILAAALVLAGPAAIAADAADKPEAQPTREAKAAFIKKCFRDRTPEACTAPPQARVQQPG